MTRILIVDDEDVYCDQLTTMLSGDGHEVRAAQNGKTAYDIAKTLNPHVLVIDWRLPNDDGLEVARVLTECLPRLQVIAMTAYDGEVLRLAAKCPLLAVLDKPFRIGQLRQVIDIAIRCLLSLSH